MKSVGQNFHRISRRNRRHSCYRITHGFARIFGRWPMAGARYVLQLFLITQISQMTQIFLRGISSSWIFSSDFTEESEAVLLSDYSRICADIWPLANGSRPICAAIVFGHADFANDAEFSSWDFLSHRFHRFTQIFFESQANRFVRFRGYLQRPNRSPPRKSVSNRLSKKSPNKFRVIR